MKIPKRTSVKTILISAIVLGIGAGATLYMIEEPEEQPDNSSIQIRLEEPQPEPVVTPSVDDVEPSEPVSEPVVNETTTNPTPPAPTQPSAPEQPQTYLFADEMEAAGIEEADFNYVTEMVLDTNGWRLAHRGKPVWHKAHQTPGTLTERLAQVNKYVTVMYEASWTKAHEAYVSTGNF